MSQGRTNEPLNPDLGAALIEAARGASFAHVLLDAARQLDAVEEVFAYSVTDRGRPTALCSSGGLCNSAECADSYARRFYREDPMLRTLHRTHRGSGFATHCHADEIGSSDYRTLCFDQARLVDKLCFGWHGDTRSLIISFYRSRSDRPEALERFARLADVGLSALARTLNAADPAGRVPLAARLRERLSLRFPELTPREREICARTLAGATADEIAAALSLRRSTVLTYRQRAYQRYGFGRASDFLAAVID